MKTSDLFAPKQWSKNGMKQIIESGFKTFDKQTNCITYGNAIYSTQYSSYIRPYCEIECNGFPFREGELLEWDLKHFNNIPIRIGKILRNKERKEKYILYEFFIYNSIGRANPIGWVITDYLYNFVDEYIKYNSSSSYAKYKAAINECKKYIVANYYKENK